MYLINKNIEFHPELYQLINRERDGQQFSLPVSASRCLLILLMHKRPVSHQELYEFAWGDQHEEITPNNLYQNISILRRTLKNIDENTSNWINTIPKKGFIFNVSIPTQEIKLASPVEEALPTIISRPETRDIKSKSLLLKLTGKKEKLKIFLFAAFFVMVFLLMNLVPQNKSVAESFVFYKKVGACRLYVNDDMQERFIHERILNELAPNCEKFPYVYASAYSIMHSATILACDKPINGVKPHCISLLLRGVKGQ
jgi:DNA-binding winged helix-turn-helix (wHTH) protein